MPRARVGRADRRARVSQGEARAGADPVAQPAAAERASSLSARVADVADLAQSDEQRMQGMHEFVGSDGNTHVFARRATVFCLSEKNPVRVGCVKPSRTRRSTA